VVRIAFGEPFRDVLCLLAFFLSFGIALAVGKRTQKAYFYYIFQILVIASFYFLRVRTDWLNLLQGYEPHTLIVFALTFFQVALYYQSTFQPVAGQTFLYGSLFLPLAVLNYEPWEMKVSGSAIFILAAIHFGLIYLSMRYWLSLIAALVLLNASLFQIWLTRGVVDPPFYGIPLGLTLIALAELHLKELPTKATISLRWAGLLAIYGSSLINVLIAFNNPVSWLILGVIALLGIIVGVVIANSFYTYLALFFFIADILGYSIKYGAEHGILEGVLVILSGVVLLAMWLYFQRKVKKV
jgi:hypothetical protein